MIQSNHYPQTQAAQRFCQFFNHRYNFIEAEVSGPGRPEWKTISAYPIEHRNLWRRYQDPNRLIGVSFGSTSHYTLLDIDIHSPYHPHNNETAFKELLGAYEDVGFNGYLLVESSESGGLHIYFPLPEAVPTHKLAVMMKLTAIRAGFVVKDGTLEIFPNAKAYNKEKPTPYKAHRLPLQKGSYLLDRNYTPYSNQIEIFLEQAEQVAQAQSMELIETAINAAAQIKAFRHIKGDGSKAVAFAQDLQEQIQEGWTGFGQTNDLLRIIGTYGRVFEALEGKELADYIVKTAKGLPGYNQYCRHQHHISNRAKDWGKCIEKYYYPYGSEAYRIGSFAEMRTQGAKEPKPNIVNEERHQSAVERIKQGMEYVIKQLSGLPQRVGERKDALIKAIKELFGVRPSDKTLNQYRQYWHPGHIGVDGISNRENLSLETAIELSTVSSVAAILQPDEVEALKALEPMPEKAFGLCHTPLETVSVFPSSEESLKTSPDKALEKSATPPPYMKVKNLDCPGSLGAGFQEVSLVGQSSSLDLQVSLTHVLTQSNQQINDPFLDQDIQEVREQNLISHVSLSQLEFQRSEYQEGYHQHLQQSDCVSSESWFAENSNSVLDQSLISFQGQGVVDYSKESSALEQTVLCPGASSTVFEPQSQAGQELQPEKTPQKSPKTVSKRGRKNRFKIGDRVISECYPADHILEIVDFHLGDRQWPRIRGDWWPGNTTELSHVSELTLVEEEH